MQSHTDLGCQSKIDIGVFIRKACRITRLYIEYAQQFVAYNHRDSHFRAGFGQEWVGEEAGLILHVIDNDRFSFARGPGNQRLFQRDWDRMRFGNQLSSDLACTGCQDQGIPVERVNMCVIESEPFLCKIYHGLKEFFRVEFGGGGRAQLCNCFEFQCPAGSLTQC